MLDHGQRQVLLTCNLDNYFEESILPCMHPIQQKLLDLARHEELDNMSLRAIAKRIGEDHPQKIKFHIEQLSKKGFIDVDENGSYHVSRPSGNLIQLPILGRANCGEALAWADEQLLGFLKLSPSVVSEERNETFIVKAVGNSMNRCSVNGMAINDGDYVVISGDDTIPSSGEYILATVDGKANIKKYVRTPDGLILLVSESSEENPPIVVDPRDKDSFIINGKVIRVISMLGLS